MIISGPRILELNEKYNLIEGLCRRELTNPEGASLDVRIGQLWNIVGDSLIEADKEDGTQGNRHSPVAKPFADVKTDGPRKITLNPGDFYLATTMENINASEVKIKYHPDLPEAYLVPDIIPRVSLQKGGVAILHTGTNPGWKGPLTVGIKNLGESNFTFEMGARLFSIRYVPVMGELKRLYTGQHQGGRVTSQGVTERQT